MALGYREAMNHLGVALASIIAHRPSSPAIRSTPTTPCVVPISAVIIPNMGTTARSSPELLAPLISKVQGRLLTILFTQAERQFHGAELIRLAGAGSGAAHRQLIQLTAAGLLVSEKIGNQKFYRANRASPIFEELRSIVLKTVGLAEPLRQALAPMASRIHAAFVYGSIAKGTATATSDIDLMVISDVVAYADLFEVLQSLEQILGRRINPSIMTLDDWRRKQLDPESFIASVAAGPTIRVLGDVATIA